MPRFQRENLEKFKPFLHKNLHASINDENNTPTARQKGRKNEVKIYKSNTTETTTDRLDL